jgi:ribosomal 30S subunit maturation factor RimM
MKTSNGVKGSFSPINGSKVRRVFSENGILLGTITKMEDNSGYRVYRIKDGKMRVKPYLKDAFKTISRSN